MLTKGKFLVSFEVPGHTKEYTEGFTEEMVIPYRTEELRPYLRYPQPKDKQQSPSLRTHQITNKRNVTNPTKRYNHNRYNITTMKKKDLIYIPHQDTWTERFPNPGSNKNDYTLYLSDPQAQYNKLLRTQQKLKNKKK